MLPYYPNKAGIVKGLFTKVFSSIGQVAGHQDSSERPHISQSVWEAFAYRNLIIALREFAA
jgi:hypothetical protein